MPEASKVEDISALLGDPLALSKATADVVDRSLGARKAVPIRNSFVRNDNPAEDPPMKKLVSIGGGRGGAVPVLLYVALIWKCAKKPFDVKLPARKWAELLGLADPTGKGARRVTHALQTLADNKLINLDKVHGEATKVTLLDESGDGSAYELPSTAYSRHGVKRDLYFKVSSKLWTSGDLQQLSASGLAMLLILLEEGGFRPSQSPTRALHKFPKGRDIWFTTENFPARYGISASMRSRGTKELEDADLLETTRMPVGPPGVLVSFTTEKVRKVYTLHGNALVTEQEPETKAKASATKSAGSTRPRKASNKKSASK